MINEYGAVGGMRIGIGKSTYWEKTCPTATSSTTNPNYMTCYQTRAAEVEKSHKRSFRWLT
jgi:hypothetical protein